MHFSSFTVKPQWGLQSSLSSERLHVFSEWLVGEFPSSAWTNKPAIWYKTFSASAGEKKLCSPGCAPWGWCYELLRDCCQLVVKDFLRQETKARWFHVIFVIASSYSLKTNMVMLCQWQQSTPWCRLIGLVYLLENVPPVFLLNSHSKPWCQSWLMKLIW